MNEFNTPITQDQRDFLAANKAELYKKDNTKLVWQNRVKMASEAYQIAKAIHADNTLETLSDAQGGDDSVEADVENVDVPFPDWSTYRDNFILDWISNRTVVTEEEADAMFNRDVESALQVIEQAEQTGGEEVSQPVVVSTPVAVTDDGATPIVAKKRGRPAGSGKTATTETKTKKSYYVPVSQRKTAKAKPAARKVASKKKKTSNGGSKSAKAQTLIEKYAARDWSRKDIISKLQSQLDLGVAYASTLYQKFA